MSGSFDSNAFDTEAFDVDSWDFVTTSAPPGTEIDPQFKLLFQVTIPPQAVCFITKMGDHMAGEGVVKTEIIAKSWITDSLFFRTTTHTTPIGLQADQILWATQGSGLILHEAGDNLVFEGLDLDDTGIYLNRVTMPVNLCFVTKTEDYLAAQVEFPSLRQHD